jgi:secreted trypsin-like serine protease
MSAFNLILSGFPQILSDFQLYSVANSWPAQVFLFSQTSTFLNGNLVKGSGELCGGTIINRYTLMTAAHCLWFTIYNGSQENTANPNDPTQYTVKW